MTVVLELRAPLRPADLQRLRAELDAADVVCHLTGALDLPSLDALVHLHLEARRRHRRLALHADDPRLLELTGLTAVRGLEVRGQAEAGEQPLGVEEVVDVGDAPA